MTKPDETFALTEYETKLLRHVATGENDPDLRWGAAMSVAMEHLQGCGLLTRGRDVQATPAGRALVATLHAQIETAKADARREALEIEDRITPPDTGDSK